MKVPETFAEAKEAAEGLGWVEKGKHTTAAQLDAALAHRLVERAQKK